MYEASVWLETHGYPVACCAQVGNLDLVRPFKLVGLVTPNSGLKNCLTALTRLAFSTQGTLTARAREQAANDLAEAAKPANRLTSTLTNISSSTTQPKENLVILNGVSSAFVSTLFPSVC